MSNINNQYQLIKKLSSGSYGIVYQAENINDKSQVAIKVEKKEKPQTLEREIQTLSRIQQIQGVPKMFWHGTQNGQSVLVLELLTKDLGQYLKEFRKFSLKTVLMIADQLLKILKSIHIKSILHRDIKPENIMYHDKKIYLVDYGISKIFRDNNLKHIPYREGRPFVGTTRYAPIAAHKGQELSRKDDLETLMYNLILFLKGVLPWQHQISTTNRDRQKLIGEKKMKINTSELCQDLPFEFKKALDHIKSLGYFIEPDYDYLINLFKKLGLKNGIEYDNIFDWCKIDDIPTQTKSTQQSEQFHQVSMRCQSLQIPSTLECLEKKQNSISNIFQSHILVQSAAIVELESKASISENDSSNLFHNLNKLDLYSNRYLEHLLIMKNK